MMGFQKGGLVSDLPVKPKTKRPPEEQCGKCGLLFGSLTWKTTAPGGMAGTRKDYVAIISREEEGWIRHTLHIQGRCPNIERLKITTTVRDQKTDEQTHFCQRCK